MNVIVDLDLIPLYYKFTTTRASFTNDLGWSTIQESKNQNNL